MRPSEYLSVLASITEPATLEVAKAAISVDHTDAIAADILQQTLERWPSATVGEITAGLQAAAFWQKLIFSMPDADPK